MTARDELLSEILQVANKHPNSRVSKLIRGVEEERSQKNIVLLLIELAEHAEYAIEFGISLKYYLDLYEYLGRGCDLILNEAALLLVNSSKIYARRVDFVQELVERQLLTLSNADSELEQTKRAQQSNLPDKDQADKPKRGRKRLLEAPSDPYEVELLPKKFRKLSNDKRMSINSRPNAKAKGYWQAQQRADTEQYLHPAVWVHSSIVDLENEEEVDSKRNYKLFTYHIDHRYSTLVPDINFRLHFKIKDYMDEAQERMESDDILDSEHENGVNQPSEHVVNWPPLSAAYVRKYLHLENHILEQELLPESNRKVVSSTKRSDLPLEVTSALNVAALDEIEDSSLADHNVPEQIAVNALENVQNSEIPSHDAQPQDDSGLGQSLLDGTSRSADCSAGFNESTLESSTRTDTTSETNNSTVDVSKSDLTLEQSLLDSSEDSGKDESGNSSNLETTVEISVSDKSNLENSEQNKSTLDESTKELEQSLLDSSEDSGKDESGNSSNLETTVEISVSDKSNLENSQHKSTLDESTKALEQSVPDDETATEAEHSVAPPEAQKAVADIDVVSSEQEIDDTQITIQREEDQINLDEIRVHLPHMDDEGVYFSDLDEQEYLMLSPKVVATDVFPSIPDKKNLTIIVDDEIKALLNLEEDSGPETFEIPVEKQPHPTPIVLNILKIDAKFLRRRILFKLGPDMELFMRARTLKRTRGEEVRDHRPTKVLKWFSMNDTDMTQVPASPRDDMETDFFGFTDDEDDAVEDFLGFSEEEQAFRADKNHRLSRDSGVCIETAVNTGNNRNLDTIEEENSNGSNSFDNVEPNFSAENPTENDAGTKSSEKPIYEAKDVGQNLPMTSSNEAQIENSEAPVDTEAEASTSATKQTQEHKDDEATAAVVDEENIVCDDDSQNDNDFNEILISKEQDEMSMANNSCDKEFRDTLSEIELSSCKTKVQQWHEHLQPILAQSRERHHFDVFQLGSEIIDGIETQPTSESTEECSTFQHVMDQKDESYVSRYFLSTLLLANQGNIGIEVFNKSSEEPSSWSDIQLKLLSTKRHTVAIEDNIGMLTNSNKAMPAAAARTSNKAKKQKIVLSSYECENEQPELLQLNESNHIEALKVNLSAVRPLKQVEKLARNGDDYDSGIFSSFSSEELTIC